MQKYDNIPLLENSCAALGYFDGLHRGHRAVIEASIKKGCTSLLFTFESEGSRKPGNSILLPDERDAMLKGMGIDCVVSPPFGDIRELSPEQFVGEVLRERLGAQKVACGEDYRFGKNAAGDSACLSRLCEQHGIECVIVPSVKLGGTAVSTSAVRAFLAEGDVESANKLLGYTYGYTLPIVHGKKLGRTIGAPTINQHFPDDFFVPRYGVYASVTSIDGEYHASVTNIGIKPTVGSPAPVSETYIHGLSQDLYGKAVEVRLKKFLRPERKFGSIEELRVAIKADAAHSLELFSGEQI